MPGDPVATAIYKTLGDKAVEFEKKVGRKITLATILVGDDVPSLNYVNLKHDKAIELKMSYVHHHLAKTASQDELNELIKNINRDDRIDGVLIQYPIPTHLSYEAAIELLSPDKDVDGLHPLNLGRLAQGVGCMVACTPLAIQAMLSFYKVQISGRHVVIVGRGMTIGRPLSILLSQKGANANACVTLVHSGVPNLYNYTKLADILIAAAGSPYLIKPEHVKPGSVVIGAGVRYEGKKLLPDVDETVQEVASMITPRVGGVGPVTVAMLFANLTQAAYKQQGFNWQIKDLFS
jgi:methylenetetrahydrofolate dehydrogenase (NADP+)/methenyltetrahydrofolate cyclohydrolase